MEQKQLNLKGIDKDSAELLKSSFKEFYEVTLNT